MRVVHLIRKDTQLRVTHIQNQIRSHRDFKASVVYKIKSENHSGYFARVKLDDYNICPLNKNDTLYSKYRYKLTKLITPDDVKILQSIVKDVDILHFHYGTDMGIYYPFLRVNRKPTVVSFYGYDCSSFPRKFFGYGKRYLQKRVFPFVNAALAMSPDMKKELINAGCPEEKIIVHYYGVETKNFYEMHDYKVKKHIHFLIISGFVDKKGHIFLLKAFQKAHQKNPNIRLTIVGNGPLKQKIKDQITTTSLSDCVELRDHVVYASEEQKQYLRNADVYIQPSVTDSKRDKEGIPASLVEAMSAGLPVISTFHAGIPYIVKNGDIGILVDEWDVDSLSEAILKVSASAKLRQEFGLKGQEYAIKNLDLQAKEKELEKIYRSLINNSKS